MKAAAHPSRRIRHLLAHSGALCVPLGAFVLLHYPPSTTSFYPRCLFFSVFHLECPGCGSTRALAALLHGHLIQALQFNAMIVVLLPAIAAFLGLSYYRALRHPSFAWPAIPTRWLALGVTIVMTFAIARDLYPLWQ